MTENDNLTSREIRRLKNLNIRVGWKTLYSPEMIYDGPRALAWTNPPIIFYIEYKGVKREISEEQYEEALERVQWVEETLNRLSNENNHN